MNAKGYALLSVVVIIGVLLVAGGATIRLTRSEMHSTTDQVTQQQTFYIADAGIHRGIAQLDQDRATAGTSTGYSYSATESFGNGSYTITISQDSLYASDATRKKIQSVGQVGSVQATTVAHVRVQNSDPCAICFSDSGDCRIVTNVLTETTLFNGLIHSNQNVSFNILAGTIFNGQGTVNAVGDLISNSAVALLTTLNANGYRGGSYVGQGIHTDPLGIPLLGIHFANGTSNHGSGPAPSVRTFRHPDYDRIKRDPNTTIVNQDNVPFGSWDVSSGTWVYTGTLSGAANSTTYYYVDGNADLTTIQLANSTNLKVVARGWIALQTLNVLTTGLLSGSSESLELIAEEELYVGRQLLSRNPLTVETESAALSAATTGIYLGAPTVATTSFITGYSETSTAWVKVSWLTALSTARVSLTGKNTTTLAFNGNVASNLTCSY